MRFTRIRVGRFGPLVELDTGEKDALPGLVTVLGPNEAGKSAFHHLLRATIHGFYPASRDQNPFTPWSGGDIDVRADLVLDSGEEWEIHRRLLSTPRAELVRGAAVEALANRSLPCAGHVDERIYRQVYAVTLADLARMQDATWDAVQDELVVGMGSRDFRSPREVARELSAAADQLWRPDRRGKPRHRELRAELSELRARRTEAKRRDDELREAETRAREIADRERELAAIRTRALEQLERLRELLPLRKRLAQIDELEDRLGDQSRLTELPRDPAGRLRELDERLRRARGEEEALASLERRIGEKIAALRGEDAAGPAGSPLEVLEGVPGEFTRALLALPVDRLRERVAALVEDRRRLDELAERLAGLESRPGAPGPILPRWVPAAGAAGVALLVGGSLLEWPGMLGIGGLLVIVAAAGLVPHLIRTARMEGEKEAVLRETEELRNRTAEADRRVARGSESVDELLDPLGLPESVTSRPTLALVAEIEGLITLLREREAKARALEAEGIDAAHAEAELGGFVQRLEAAGGGADADGVATVEERIRELEYLERLRRELVRDAGDLGALRDRIRELEQDGETWVRVPERIAGEEGRLREVDRELQELREEAGEVRERSKTLAREETVDLVDGRILELEDELREVERERDRRMVLARLLDRAEARFRAEHQPDLLRRAEAHLSAFTGGRYSRILLDGEEGPDGLRLHAEHLPELLPVSTPLSTGTREQVYVALRLAIVDHLDEGRETLPLLLDEVFVNWDPDRRAAALDVMARFSEERQVFVFTCHPHLAEEVRERGGAVLSLEAPSGVGAHGG